jgi:hypothetical protein
MQYKCIFPQVENIRTILLATVISRFYHNLLIHIPHDIFHQVFLMILHHGQEVFLLTFDNIGTIMAIMI